MPLNIPGALGGRALPKRLQFFENAILATAFNLKTAIAIREREAPASRHAHTQKSARSLREAGASRSHAESRFSG